MRPTYLLYGIWKSCAVSVGGMIICLCVEEIAAGNVASFQMVICHGAKAIGSAFSLR